jgi:hypothetical protein
MRVLLAIVFGFIATAANAGSCQFIANRIYCDNGLSGQRLGSFTYWNDGFTSRHAGNFIYNSDGSSSQRIGNHTYYNDGSSSYRNGDFTYLSNGTRCDRIVNQVHCDWACPAAPKQDASAAELLTTSASAFWRVLLAAAGFAFWPIGASAR